MVGVKNGRAKAEAILKSGKAEKKLREIIQAQGGDPKIKPQDIKIGDKHANVKADKDGSILWINNDDIARVAREAGAPKEQGAGVVLRAKLADHIKKGETLFEVYAERSTKLRAALELAEKLKPLGLSRKPEERMIMERIPIATEHKKAFILER
jgi:AMP phosphorylase